MLEQGRQRHMAGDLAGAAELYEKVLAENPRHGDALNLLGVVRLQTGYVYHYAFAMLIGVALLTTWYMFAGT